MRAVWLVQKFFEAIVLPFLFSAPTLGTTRLNRTKDYVAWRIVVEQAVLVHGAKFLRFRLYGFRFLLLPHDIQAERHQGSRIS